MSLRYATRHHAEVLLQSVGIKSINESILLCFEEIVSVNVILGYNGSVLHEVSFPSGQLLTISWCILCVDLTMLPERTCPFTVVPR